MQCPFVEEVFQAAAKKRQQWRARSSLKPARPLKPGMKPYSEVNIELLGTENDLRQSRPNRQPSRGGGEDSVAHPDKKP